MFFVIWSHLKRDMAVTNISSSFKTMIFKTIPSPPSSASVDTLQLENYFKSTFCGGFVQICDLFLL